MNSQSPHPMVQFLQEEKASLPSAMTATHGEISVQTPDLMRDVSN